MLLNNKAVLCARPLNSGPRGWRKAPKELIVDFGGIVLTTLVFSHRAVDRQVPIKITFRFSV